MISESQNVQSTQTNPLIILQVIGGSHVRREQVLVSKPVLVSDGTTDGSPRRPIRYQQRTPTSGAQSGQRGPRTCVPQSGGNVTGASLLPLWSPASRACVHVAAAAARQRCCQPATCSNQGPRARPPSDQPTAAPATVSSLTRCARSLPGGSGGGGSGGGSKLDTAHEVGGQGCVDLLGVGQVEARHYVDKFLPALGQPRVQALLLADRRDATTLVVVRREEQRVVGKRQYVGVDVVVERACRAGQREGGRKGGRRAGGGEVRDTGGSEVYGAPLLTAWCRSPGESACCVCVYIYAPVTLCVER